MKAKDLIKILEQYPDFEIRTTVVHQAGTTNNPFGDIRHYKAVGVDEVGLSHQAIYVDFTEINV